MKTSLEDVYARRCAAGELRHDGSQVAALRLLEPMRGYLESSPAGGLAGMLWRSAPKPPKGLYLWGGVGEGKSMLMDLFFSELRIEGKRRVHFHEFMQDVHARMHRIRQGNTDDALKPIAADLAGRLRLLCLDEMQVSDIADAMVVGRLFELLVSRGLVFVATSNRPPDDLYKNGLNRRLFLPFIDLLKRSLVIHELGAGMDYRQNRIAGLRTYFAPVEAGTAREVDRIWEGLSGGEAGPMAIRSQGRDVAIPLFRNGAARAGFADLCERPLGPADYLALAGMVRALVLENVPVMGRTQANAAKRFATLVDALYEARVMLVVSAQAEPEELFRHGEGSFEFQRTASRLREMQSADWIARPPARASAG